MDGEEQKRLNDDIAFNLITESLEGHSISSLQRMSLMERRESIQQLKEFEGLSIRQIVRITGLTYHEVYKLKIDKNMAIKRTVPLIARQPAANKLPLA